MHPLEQRLALACSHFGPKIGCTEPVSVLIAPSAPTIRMQSEEFCTIDCSRSRLSWATCWSASALAIRPRRSRAKIASRPAIGSTPASSAGCATPASPAKKPTGARQASTR